MLRVIVGLTALFFALNAYALNGSEEHWGVTEETDGFTDNSVVTAMVVAEGGPENGFILLTCYSDGFEGKVSAGEYIGDKRIRDNFKFRVDEENPVELTMKPTSKTYVYFNNFNSPFFKALENGKSTILVQLRSYDYDTSSARYTLRGSTNAVREVKEACKNRGRNAD
ncbi:MAG: hypothetical protein WD623_16890 [Marinobacter sp.]|uniref:hypothetical protein n=1 Tax=Marinobacter sp. TaxID=50741 RepID=UPI0034A07168